MSEGIKKNRLGTVLWVVFVFIAVYSLFGAVSTATGRPIDALVRLSEIYYPFRIFPHASWSMEDHLALAMVCGIPALFGLVKAAYLPTRRV
jgi:presenilin-like A22 family membrane protease